MENNLTHKVATIIKKIHYLTIASVCSDGTPWNSPVSATLDPATITFFWGSSPDNIHSKNITSQPKVFIVIYDSTAPEGTGEGVYMQGIAKELDWEVKDVIKGYSFTPERVWINSEERNEDGSYRHDIRIEVNLNELKEAL